MRSALSGADASVMYGRGPSQFPHDSPEWWQNALLEMRIKLKFKRLRICQSYILDPAAITFEISCTPLAAH